MPVLAVLIVALCLYAIFRAHRPIPTPPPAHKHAEPVDLSEGLRTMGGWRATLPYGERRLP